MRIRVLVTPRKAVLDPQGRAVAHGLSTLGFDTVRDARVGRVIDLEIDAPPEQARLLAADAAQRLLANPIVEDWEIL
jgi:phosphoribosylformylglycinamidine synthase